jgi:hypothetical protein
MSAPKKSPKPPKKPRGQRDRSTAASSAEVQQRVTQVLRLRLNGAQWHDLQEFARAPVCEAREGPPWDVGDVQLRAYITASNKLLAEAASGERRPIYQLHLAQRQALYARAIDTGDLRTALAILKDEAELRGLYENEALAALETAVAELKARLDGTGNAAQGPDRRPDAA